MTTSRDWYSFFVVAALILAEGLYGEFTFSLEPKAIQPGERATLTLRLPEKDLLKVPTGDDEIPEAQDEWLVKTESLELLDQDYRKADGQYVWTYQFTAYANGDISIPPISVVLGPQSFSTERATLKVQSSRADSDLALRPDAGEMHLPWNLGRLLKLLLLFSLSVWAFGLLKKYWRKPKAEAPLPASVTLEDPIEWLRKQLLVLRAKLDSKPDDSEAPDRWALILREFASRQTSHPVTAWTSDEMKRRLNSEKWQLLSSWMKECDRYKFAPDRGGSPNPAQQTLHWIEESERLFL